MCYRYSLFPPAPPTSTTSTVSSPETLPGLVGYSDHPPHAPPHRHARMIAFAGHSTHRLFLFPSYVDTNESLPFDALTLDLSSANGLPLPRAAVTAAVPYAAPEEDSESSVASSPSAPDAAARTALEWVQLTPANLRPPFYWGRAIAVDTKRGRLHFGPRYRPQSNGTGIRSESDRKHNLCYSLDVATHEWTEWSTAYPIDAVGDSAAVVWNDKFIVIGGWSDRKAHARTVTDTATAAAAAPARAIATAQKPSIKSSVKPSVKSSVKSSVKPPVKPSGKVSVKPSVQSTARSGTASSTRVTAATATIPISAETKKATGDSADRKVAYAAVRDCYAFDLASGATGRWQPFPPLNSARAGATVLEMDGSIVVIGGCDQSYPHVPSARIVASLSPSLPNWVSGIERFDLANSCWTLTSAAFGDAGAPLRPGDTMGVVCAIVV